MGRALKLEFDELNEVCWASREPDPETKDIFGLSSKLSGVDFNRLRSCYASGKLTIVRGRLLSSGYGACSNYSE